MSNITLTEYKGKNKEGKEFTAFRLKAGLFTSLIFPRGPIETEYLRNYLKKDAHTDFLKCEDDDLSNLGLDDE